MDATRKHSKKRDAILECLQERSDHPSADQIFRSLKAQRPELSLGTVYRNLGILVQDGVISSAGQVNGQERYEARTDPHPHFMCRRCNRLTDLDLPDLEKDVYDKIRKNMGYIPESHTLTIIGICSECAKDETTHRKKAASSKKWICAVCGHVHEGAAPPELCPVCKVTSSHFHNASSIR